MKRYEAERGHVYDGVSTKERAESRGLWEDCAWQFALKPLNRRPGSKSIGHFLHCISSNSVTQTVREVRRH